MDRLTQADRPLVDALRRSQQAERHSFHMPGHKGATGDLDAVLGVGITGADVSEMDGWFPYLHAPTGPLVDAQQLAAERWGADVTFFLINGTTIGNVAAILSCVGDGDAIMVCRGSHRSVYAALSLSGATPVYLPPARHSVLDGEFTVSIDDAARTLDRHPQVKAIHLTRPNYYGMCTDVEGFATLAHDRGIPLIVDEAHGAHFGLYPSFPMSALAGGADIVVQSTHKTLGALTQASMLHLRRGRVDERRLAQQLQTLQSSSPSVLLSVSLDIARSAATPQAMAKVAALTASLRRDVGALQHLTLHGAELVGDGGVVAVDDTKLVIDVHRLGRNGFAVADELRQLGIGPELADGRRVVVSVTVGDTEQSIRELVEALSSLVPSGEGSIQTAPSMVIPTIATTIRDAERAESTPIAVADAEGRICTEYVIPYPPGIPLVAPGEVLTFEVLCALTDFQRAGSKIVGPSDPTVTKLSVRDS